MNTSPSSIPFNQTEEAFFLSCVGEVRKVWASKSGHANLNISVQNGMAELQLAFKLGLPGDSHLTSYPTPHHPRYKTPARKAKDRARAAAHQQAQLTRTSSDFNQSQELPQQHVQGQQHGAPPAALKTKAAPAYPQGSPVPSQGPPDSKCVAAALAAVSSSQADSAPAKPQVATASNNAAPASTNAAPAFPVPTKPTNPNINVSDAGPAPPPQQQALAPQYHPQAVKQAVPADQNPPENIQNSESTRKWNKLAHKANRISENFTMNYKIANCNCQHQIEDNFWEILKEAPDEYFKEDKVDDDKIREAYKLSARKFRIWMY